MSTAWRPTSTGSTSPACNVPPSKLAGGGTFARTASISYDQATLDGICSRLRVLVQDALRSHVYPTAIFFADKLYSLSATTDDLCLLAECYFHNREHRRVLHLLQKNGSASRQDDRLKLLIAQSLAECKEWEECLRFLEENSPSEGRIGALFASLRGKVYEIMENQEHARTWYTRAVQMDPYCHEAVDRLVGSHLLTLDKEVALLSSLKLHEQDQWLVHTYAAKLAAFRSGVLNPFDPQAGADPTSDVALQSQADRSGGTETAYPAKELPVGLASNGDILSSQCTRHFYEGDYQSCYATSKKVLEEDPYHLNTLPVHIASAVMLEMKTVVFYVAHQLVSAYPATAVAWFTAGCYYYLIKKYDHSRRFFQKALSFDQNFAPAWIAYGHAFAHHDESDQALAAYRTASRLFPGSHLPWLFIGMEYVRTNSLHLAKQCLECSRILLPTDPHVYNELGVVEFQYKNYSKACEIFRYALQLCTTPQGAFFANLGHALLKCRAHDRALEAFQQARKLDPQNASVLSGVAVSQHLLGNLKDAIDNYHRALSLQRDDAFTAEMLNIAVQECAEQPMNMEI